jgi:hypothetical protein
MMAHARSRGRARRPGSNMPNHGWLIFNRPEQHWFFRLLGLIVRARAELTLITVTVTAYIQLRHHYDPQTVLIGMGVVTIAVFAIPPTRRYLWRRIWCVITRRRLRACMTQTFTMARANGRLPFLLWARPSPVGEHVLVWLPAGMAVKDLERITGELAAACWATDARILPSKRRAFLAHIHVIRRDTLGAVGLSPEVIDELDHDHTTGARDTDTRPVYPYLVRDPEQERAGLAALTPSINRTAAIAEPAPSSNDDGSSAALSMTAGPASKASAGKPTTAPASDEDDTAVTGYGGLDVSDYV